MVTGASATVSLSLWIFSMISDAWAMRFCEISISCAARAVNRRKPLWASVSSTPLVQRMNSTASLSIIRRAGDGSETVVYKATEVEIAAGDTVTFLTAGGGGYGDPGERDREAAARDIAAGVVSPERAAKHDAPAESNEPAAVTEPA